MALIKPSRAAQYPLVQEYVFNFGDTVVNTSGATTDFNAVTAGTIVPMFTLPQGAVVMGGDILVETAYATSATATLSIGDSGSATKYASAVDLKSAARTALTIPDATTGGLNVIGTLAIATSASTAGKVRVRIEYTIEGRSNEVQST